jgi:hypothetical protein
MIFNLNIVDLTIVLRPARSKAQVPGFDRVSFFFKNQNDVVLVKKIIKSTGLQPGLARSTRRISRVFPYPVFSSTRPSSSPESTRRAGFQNYGFNYCYYIMK